MLKNSSEPGSQTAIAEPLSQGLAQAGASSVVVPRRSVTLRAVLLGLALLPLNAYWIVEMEFQRFSAHPTTVSLFFNCIFFLVLLIGLNKLIGKMKPSWQFSQGELLLVYSMLCIASCMASHDMSQVLVPSLAYPFAKTNTATPYLSLFGQYLPRWAMVSNANAVNDFYQGHSTLYTRSHLAAWLPATLLWTGFIGVLLWVMQCVNVIIRKQWTESEKLGYPLVRMPLEMTASQPGGSGGASLIRSRLFWLGFAVAATLDIVNTLNYYFPSVPALIYPGHGQTFYDLETYAVGKPWNAIGWTPMSFFPFIIGIGIQLPMDFLFSTWFFYIFWKLEAVATVAGALDADPQMPYVRYQALGAYLLFFVSTIWLSRGYLRDVFAKALGKPSSLDDSEEPIRYRTALIGIIVGLAALVGFSYALGLSVWLGIIFFVLYLALALAITRMRAEMGTPIHDLHFTGPDWTLSDLLGPRTIGPHGLTAFSLFYFFNRAYRSHPMPFQLEGMKMAEQTGAKREMRGWMLSMMLAGVFGMLCAFWAILHTTYIRGNPFFGNETWDRLTTWIKLPEPPKGAVSVAIGAGFVIAAFLQFMRTLGIWWPFHPLAFAVSSSWEMNLLWFPLLIAWAVKGLLLRYGGASGYQRSLPFFYGLILGQFIPGSLLNIWGIITDNPTFQFWQ